MFLRNRRVGFSLILVKETKPMDDSVDIRELVDRARDYDVEAFGQLYDRYYDKIFSFVYYKVGNRFEAEDISEQVFLKALENITKFKWQGTPFSSWLFRIASNLVVDYFRSGKYKMVDIDGELAIEASTSCDPEQSTIRSLDRDEIINAIRTLTEEQQQVIVMKFIAGMTNHEIAGAINKSVGAVKALQHRATGALSKVLGGVYCEAQYK